MIFSLLMQLLDSAFLLVAHVSGSRSFPRPLTPQQEALAVARMEQGDPLAARELIEHNLRLVAHIAKKYRDSQADQDDLVSIGTIGLIKAVHSFRPQAGKLTSYAARCIENEILMTLRSGRKLRGNLSLNEPIGSDREGNQIMLADVLGTEPDLVSRQAETRIESARALGLVGKVLSGREKAVIVLRYGLMDGAPRPQHQVARLLGISRSYVSRIEKKALGKLRQAMGG